MAQSKEQIWSLPKESENKESQSYYSSQARQYFNNPWVLEVAGKVASVMDRIRPFQPNDIFIDIGAGPGLTLERIFYIDEEEKATVGNKGYLVDLSPEMITLSKFVHSIRCPEKGLMIKQMNIFDALKSTQQDGFNGFSADFSMLLQVPPRIDCAYCSLVAEYFSRQQIIELSKALFDKLSIGGIIAFFEWGRHFKYDDAVCADIYFPRGISKKDWLLICAELTEYVENPHRIVQEEINGENKFKRFGTRSQYTVGINIGTFDVEHADKQKTPSADFVHYCILQKQSVPSSIMVKQATERIRKPLQEYHPQMMTTDASVTQCIFDLQEIKKQKEEKQEKEGSGDQGWADAMMKMWK